MNDTEIWAFLSGHLHTSCKKNHKRNRIDYKKYKAHHRENRRLTRNSDRDSHGVTQRQSRSQGLPPTEEQKGKK